MSKLKHILVGSTLATGIAFTGLAGAGVGAAQAAPLSVQATAVKVIASKATTVNMKTTTGLNLRASGSVKSKVVKVLSKGTTVQVLGTKSGWKKVKAGSSTGWVSAKYLSNVSTAKTPAKPKVVKAPVAKVSIPTMKTSANLNLRTGSNTSSKVIKVLKKGSVVQVLGNQSGWSKVKSGSSTGWVSSQYLTKVGAVSKSKPKTVKVTNATAALRLKVINEAKKHVGAKYRYGGTSPKTGWDCSGYIQYVFKKSGKNIPRTKAWVGNKRITKAQAQPGDFVVQNNGSHVGIYAGNGKMYHAANPRTDTTLASTAYGINTQYYSMTK